MKMKRMYGDGELFELLNTLSTYVHENTERYANWLDHATDSV
jgi:hypothetical protein